jgi:non-ribosomal peptide synthase protein (TIGR01720 family)
MKDRAVSGMRIGAELTRQLLQEVPKVYHTEINDILLCALALTLGEWSGRRQLIVGLEGHGREVLGGDTDTSRTVGWFTNLYPVLLELEGSSGMGDSIRSIKEQLRGVPDKGLGYGVLKYLNKESWMGEPEPWHVVFNYLGQLDNVMSGGRWLSVAGESSGNSIGGDHELGSKLTVHGKVQSGELLISWNYSGLHYRRETIEKLSGRYHHYLQLLAGHCREQSVHGSIATPSDYGLTGVVTYQELDAFLDARDSSQDEIMEF